MNRLVVFISLIGFVLIGTSQTPVEYFNKSANQFIDLGKKEALNTLDEGLKKFPNDPRLNELKKRLLENDQQDKQDQKL